MQRQLQHRHIAVNHAGRKNQIRPKRNRHHKDIDQHQIKRKQPRRPLDMRRIPILDDRHMKLARQQQNHRGGERGHRYKGCKSVASVQEGLDVGPCRNRRKKRVRPAKHPPNNKKPNGQKRCELDHGFNRNRECQSALVVPCIDMAGSENSGEGGQHQRDDQRQRSRAGV